MPRAHRTIADDLTRVRGARRITFCQHQPRRRIASCRSLSNIHLLLPDVYVIGVWKSQNDGTAHSLLVMPRTSPLMSAGSFKGFASAFAAPSSSILRPVGRTRREKVPMALL
jgi:hypothetical protein